MLMASKAKESILRFCFELCLAVSEWDDGEKEKVSTRIFELHMKKNLSFTMYVYLQYQQIKKALIYALISSHPARVVPWECAGICTTLFTKG